MKGISTLLLVFGFLAFAAQATYIRVIHAVPPGDMMMDVYYTARDTGDKIRLFQDLNYTDIPPYFFIPVLQNNERVELSFLLKSSENRSEELVPQDQLRNLPSHTVTLRSNQTYTLVVTSSAQNQTSGQDQGSQGQIQGQQGNQNLEYLLLNDFNQEEVPEDFKLVRLINLAEDASPISLIDDMGDCTQENQTSSDGNLGNQEEGNQGDQGSEPLARDIAFLEASDYIDLPQQTEPTNLFICHLGEKIPVIPAPLYRSSGSRFSILLFTGSSQMNENQSQGTEGQDQGFQDQGSQEEGSQDQGSQDQGQGTEGQDQEFQDQGSQEEGSQDLGSQDQGMEGEQSQYIAYIVSDEPVTTQNVRIRIVHAESSLPAVNVMLDGQQIFQQVSFGNVTEYHMTVRGIHNISISAQGNQQSGNASSIKIVTFFAWTKSYSIAVVRTSSGEMGLESQGQEEGVSEQGQGSMIIGQPTQMAGTFPGFQGEFHKIFVDQISQNATLGSNYAYVQFVHLVPNVGTVNVNVGNQNITNIRFLQTSQYRSVLATSQQVPIEVLLASSNTPVFNLSTTLKPGTLYTLWALQEQNSSSPLIFLTTDRQIQVQCVVMDANTMGSSENQGQGSQE